MAKTVKELADELGVSKSGIRKYLNASFREQYTFKNANRIVIEEAGVKEIKKKIKNGNAHETRTENAPDDDESVRLGSVLIKQLQEKDDQIGRLQKLLDQSQQLQLMAENKIKQLENKTTDEQDRKGSSEEPVQNSNEDDPVGKAERGFWSRLFNK